MRVWRRSCKTELVDRLHPPWRPLPPKTHSDMDVGAMAKWITFKVTNAACDVSQLGERPSNGAAAERLTASLDKLWGEAANFDTERLRYFLDTMGPATQAAEREIHFDGHLLRRRARKAKHKAGGLDGWSGELVAALPLDFFNHLARIWTAIVNRGKLPLRWKQVRVAGIPKPDGGLRPLALTQMAWRLGASEMLAQLRPWFSSWMPECLHGGLPGRSVDAIHEQLGSLLEQRAAKRTFVGCKADVRKCFDRVSPQAAIAILQWWGAPTWLATLLEDFYMGHSRP